MFMSRVVSCYHPQGLTSDLAVLTVSAIRAQCDLPALSAVTSGKIKRSKVHCSTLWKSCYIVCGRTPYELNMDWFNRGHMKVQEGIFHHMWQMGFIFVTNLVKLFVDSIWTEHGPVERGHMFKKILKQFFEFVESELFNQ